MYESDRNVEPAVSIRENAAADCAEFGMYAVRTSTPNIRPGSVSAPQARAAGATVVARFTMTDGPGAGADAPECLATFRPDEPGPYSAAFILDALTRELAAFVRMRFPWDLAESTLREIALERGSVRTILLDGKPASGWALVTRAGASGLAVSTSDRVITWLGTEDASIPAKISTSDLRRVPGGNAA
jgi:hypothetical protein